MNAFKDPAELAIMEMRLFNLTYYVANEKEIIQNTKAIKKKMEGEK